MNVKLALTIYHFGLALQAWSENDEEELLENQRAIGNLCDKNSSRSSDDSSGLLGALYICPA